MTDEDGLVRCLLEGRQTANEELTKGIALWVTDTLRSAPPEFRAEFLGKPNTAIEPPERLFIRTLLERQADEETIVREFADRLLDGRSNRRAQTDLSANSARKTLNRKRPPTVITRPWSSSRRWAT